MKSRNLLEKMKRKPNLQACEFRGPDQAFLAPVDLELLLPACGTMEKRSGFSWTTYTRNDQVIFFFRQFHKSTGLGFQTTVRKLSRQT